MSWFTNLKTAKKLLVFFGLTLVSLALTAWTGVSSARAMRESQVETYEIDLRTIEYLQRLAIERLRITRTVRDAIIAVDPAKVKEFTTNVDGFERNVRAALDEGKTLVRDEAARAVVDELGTGFNQYMQYAHDAIALSPQKGFEGDPEKMRESLASMSRMGSATDLKIKAQIERLRDQAAARAVAGKAAYEQNLRIALALFALAVAVGAGITHVINGAIATPLKATVALLERVAEGDLTVTLDSDRTDEVGDMAKALNASLESMRSTLAQVAEVSTEVSSASSELASNAQAISSGAQEQAASLEETAASLEEISSTVKQNTDNAQEASQLANSARDSAERGGQVVSSAVSAMEEITRSSKKIADIIATIDEIAFQTNLLALNAAVEAARAGEQGRGFAVVAAEVRTLAQRTGTAAKEIRGLIADSSAKVEVGTHQVNESGRTLEEIVKSVKRVTDMVAEIAAASREQNVGLDQVNTAVTQVDQVTQSNAAQTEELSATATSLSDKSTQLQALVSAFELGAVGGAPKKVARPAPASAPRTYAAPAHSSVMPVARRSAPKKVANGGYEEF